MTIHLGGRGAGHTSRVLLGSAALPAYVLQGAPNFLNMLAGTTNSYAGANWSYTNVSGVASSGTAPDGSNTLFKLTDNATNGFHYISQTITRCSTGTAANCNYRIMVEGKAGTLSRILLAGYNAAGGGAQAIFDLAGGQMSGLSLFGPGQGSSVGLIGGGSGIKPIGNGVYQCWVDFWVGSGLTVGFNLELDSGSGMGAISNSYAGTGKYLYLWRTNILPLAAWGIKTKRFSDSFSSSSTVDMSNTQTPGFNWYPSASFPLAGASNWQSLVSPQAGDLSLAGGHLTLSTDRSGFGVGLCTAVKAANANHYNGYAVQPPFIFNLGMSFDPTKALLADTSWPIGWLMSAEFMFQGATRVVEHDLFEPIPSGTGTINSPTGNTHDWNMTTGVSQSVNMAASIGSPTYTNFNTTTKMILSAAFTSNLGMIQNYYNGVFVPGSEITYSSGAGSNPIATSSNPGSWPSNANGVISPTDSAHYVGIIGAGTGNWPTSFNLSEFWTP